MTSAESIELVTGFYSQAFNDGEPEKAAARALGASYIQHNPGAPDGAAAFVGYVTYMRSQFPQLQLDRGLAVADFWRLEDGKIVEHWDVIQEVPAEAKNTNSMF